MMKPAGSNSIKGFFHGIRFELLIYYFSITIIVMALGLYLVYNSTINILQKRSEEYIHEQFRQSEYSIQNLAKEIDKLSKLFLIDNKVQEFLKTENMDFTYESVDMQQVIFQKMDGFIASNSLINSIYLFSKSKLIGKSFNRSVVIRQGGEHKFYTTGMYDKAWNAYPKAVWKAGITEDWYYDIVNRNNASYIVSYARAAKPVLEAKLTSVVVFNIEERDLCSTYSKLNDFGDNLTYIIDSNGNIISSIRKEDLGKKGKFIPETGVDFKSFNINEGKTKKMIVYYKISDTDWYIVRETPWELFTKDVITMQKMVMLVFIIGLMLIVVVSFISMKRITDPLSSLAAKMKDMGRGNLGITFPRIPKNELGLVIMRFNEMSLNIRELVKQNTEVEREKKELEIEALQYQINPHFLYNTLNMIKWMAAVIKAENIMDSVVALGNILRMLLSSNNPMCLLREEMSYLENYIKIMNWRFNNKIVFKFDIADHLMDCRIIKFILQPVIENSVVHGMSKQNNRIEIVIHTEERGEALLVIISDNGAGISPENLINLRNDLDVSLKQNKKEKIGSIGLSNVNRRIKLNFGEIYGINIESCEDKGTNVSILLPKLM